MTEVFGAVASGFALLGLFKKCVEACELIRAAKNKDKDLEKLDLKFAVEQCRLRSWGESMGLGQRHNLLDGFRDRALVEQALQHIFDLLTSSEHMSRKCGARRVEVGIEDAPPSYLDFDPQVPSAVSKLQAAFKWLKVPASSPAEDSVKKKVFWVLRDRKKYAELISELQTMVDAVRNVTKELVSHKQQEQLVISRINNINDARTLELLTQVCEVDHPALSNAASVRAEVLSLSTNRVAEIVNWIDDTEARTRSHVSRKVEDMESWDIREFRQQYLDLLKSRGEQSQSRPERLPERQPERATQNQQQENKGQEHKREQAAQASSSNDRRPLEWFACPFYVHNPECYKSVDICGNSGWTSVDQLM